MNALLRKTLFLPALVALGRAADLTSSGDWSEAITGAHLTAGAGSDLQSQVDSVAGVTTLTIANAPGAWSLRAQRSAGGWSSGVTLHVKRTSAGSGSGTISGGTTFVELTGSDTEIFSGTEDRSNVSLQFRLSGLSRGIAPATYFSSITFTVQ